MYPFVLSDSQIEDLTEQLVGNSHSEINRILDLIFPADDEVVQRWWNGGDITVAEEVEVHLAVTFRADIEVAAKQGFESDVFELLHEANDYRKEVSPVVGR